MIAYDISKQEFHKIADYIYKQVGIHLAEHKINLVRSRLSKRLRHYGFKNFTQYYEYLLHDSTGEELRMLTNEISTNVTSFFREASQWEYLAQEIKKIEKRNEDRKIRVWSAACSSGQEPYSIAIFLMQHLGLNSKWDIKILATDISEDVLSKAVAGRFDEEDMGGVSQDILRRFFVKKKKIGRSGVVFEYWVKESIKELVVFRKYNLVHGDYRMMREGIFDLVFCRNVMIYFDKVTKSQVVLNLYNTIKKGGHLLIGHSESLVTMEKNQLKLQAPSVYKKI